ncbi:hypothetical protein OROGR_022368 [Orobanche gracilis]
METSLRYGGNYESLRIHAKEKIPVTANTLCQFNGELDTKIGAPTYLNAMIRYFYPDLSASFSVGADYTRQSYKSKIHFNIGGKKVFPVTSDGLLSFYVKGRCKIDEDFKEIKHFGAAEFVWNVFNVKKDQDLRLKIGYDVPDKIPYLQIRENNWTFNADGKCRWNVRYDL